MDTVVVYPCAYADSEAPTFVETYETTAPPFESAYHMHADGDWEVQYLAHGKASYSVDGNPCGIGTGELLIITPDQPHVCETSLGRRRTVTFRAPSLRAMPFEARRDRQTGGLRIEGRRLPARAVIPPEHRMTVERTVALLDRESSLGEPMARAMCHVLLSQFLLMLARLAREAETPVTTGVSPEALRTVEQLCAELRTSLDYPWTLAEMVRRSGYSASQLYRLFHQATALSPGRWLREERVRGARELLVQTDRRVSEIAAEVGFESRCQLHRVFREITGMSPNEYRVVMRTP